MSRGPQDRPGTEDRFVQDIVILLLSCLHTYTWDSGGYLCKVVDSLSYLSFTSCELAELVHASLDLNSRR